MSGTGITAANKKEAEHFSQGLHYTDEDVKDFVKKLDSLNKPVIWVFYGDHLPGIYNLPTEVQKYSTDYFIYANKYAREHGAKTKLANTQYVSTNDFIALALEQANAKVDAYSALLTDVADQLPAIWFSNENSNSQTPQFVNAQGKTVNYNSLTKKQKTLFHDYELLQYDITQGKQYAVKDGMTTTVSKAK